jgi:glutamate-1-semialdehyde 2,1-aminomutase
MFAAASRIVPGGVDSPVRAFKSLSGTPLFIARARGARLEDADGNTYIDYVMSSGPLIHGHAPKGLLKAVMQVAARGTSFGAPTELETASTSCGKPKPRGITPMISAENRPSTLTDRLQRPNARAPIDERADGHRAAVGAGGIDLRQPHQASGSSYGSGASSTA